MERELDNLNKEVGQTDNGFSMAAAKASKG